MSGDMQINGEELWEFVVRVVLRAALCGRRGGGREVIAMRASFRVLGEWLTIKTDQANIVPSFTGVEGALNVMVKVVSGDVVVKLGGPPNVLVVGMELEDKVERLVGRLFLWSI